MKRNGSNINMERIQDVPYDYSFIDNMNNNLPTMANNNLVDLSQHPTQVYDLTTQGNMQTDPSCNRAIQTKGAMNFIVDNNVSSHQSTLSNQFEAINYAIGTKSVQQPLHDLSAIDAPSVQYNNNGEFLNPLSIFEDISSVESQHNDENNTKNEEVDQTYSALDHSTLSQLEKHSELNKTIIQTLLNNFTIVMLPSLLVIGQGMDAPGAKCFIDGKAFQGLVRCIMDIVVNFPQNYMNKPSCNKDTQTEIDSKEPQIVANKHTQTDAESVSVPRIKINPRSNKVHQNKESSKEQIPRCCQNKNASNQNTNVYNIHQEQFYDTQQLYPQLPSDQSYVMQTPESNRNNMQPQMMQYGMPQTNAMQRTESGNNGVQMMQGMNPYGIPHSQTANTMMQRPDCCMSGIQMSQTGMPQHDSAAIVQRVDANRNRMKPILQARSSHPPNATVVPVNPTYYNQRKSGNALRQEIPREMQRSQPQLQTVPRAPNPSSVFLRGRRTHGYYAAANPPYPNYPQWHVPSNQNQYGNN